MSEKAKDAELADRLEAVLGSLSWCIHRHSQSEDAERWIRHRKVVEGDLVTIRHAIAALAFRDAEIASLRKALEAVYSAEDGFWGFPEEFDNLVRLGLLVPVPADEAYREEYENDTMYVWAWHAHLHQGEGET
jgi:hypothetical protein